MLLLLPTPLLINQLTSLRLVLLETLYLVIQVQVLMELTKEMSRSQRCSTAPANSLVLLDRLVPEKLLLSAHFGRAMWTIRAMTLTELLKLDNTYTVVPL